MKEEIKLIKRAVELGLVKKEFHPITKLPCLLNYDNIDVINEWEELEKEVNSQRNIKVNISLNKKVRKQTIQEVLDLIDNIRKDEVLKDSNEDWNEGFCIAVDLIKQDIQKLTEEKG